MKNLVLFLIITPIFLISSLNFHLGNNDTHHSEEANRFTCTSCHASIVDGIIIGGKLVDIDMITVDVLIPDNIIYDNLIFDASNDQVNDNIVTQYTSDAIGEYLSFELQNGLKGKKENKITIEHILTEEDRAAGFIEIQGVFSNLDGTKEGDFAFSKKVSIDEDDITEIVEPVRLFPSITNNFIQLENLTLNNSLQIFNMLGQQVLNKQTISSSEKLDVSNFENGNYFVLVNQKEQLRFVVSK